MEKNGTPASPATARASSVLPVPGGPEEQHALGDPGAEPAEPLGVGEEVLDLLQLLDRLVGAGDVGEGDTGLVQLGLAGLGPAEPARPAAALHLHHEPEEHADDEQRRQEVVEEALERRSALGVAVDLDAGRPAARW